MKGKKVSNLEDESAHHIILECPFAKAFWGSIGVHQLPDTISDIHSLCRPAGVPEKFFSTFVVLCCWQLWKRRNGVVFRAETATLRQFLQVCILDVLLWKLRLPKKENAAAEFWISVFRSAM